MTNQNRVVYWIPFLLIFLIACQTVTGVFTNNQTIAPNTNLLPDQTDNQSPPDIENPASEPTSVPSPTATVETFNLSGKQQIDILKDLWGLVNAEYLYEDFNGTDWEAEYDIVKNLIDEGISDQTFYFALSEMVYHLGDEHSAFLSPDEVIAEEQTYESNLDYVGIGVYVSAVPNTNRAVILLTMTGGPAEAAGLKEHDNILAADGHPVVDDEGYLLETLLGIEGTDVTVLVQTPGEEPREIVITRGKITGGLPVPHQVLTSKSGKRIGYLIIPTFSDGSIGEIIGDALQEMDAGGELDGLIIDNRLNDGGYDNVLKTTLSYFVEGNVGSFVNRNNKEPLVIEANEIGNSQSYPIVVLVGTETISFGEIFGGILQDQGRATIMGETTLGNVEILWGYDFKDGSRAWIAHDTFRPSINPEANWEINGIIPAVEVIVGWHEVTVETDPAVLTALDFLDGE